MEPVFDRNPIDVFASGRDDLDARIASILTLARGRAFWRAIDRGPPSIGVEDPFETLVPIGHELAKGVPLARNVLDVLRGMSKEDKWKNHVSEGADALTKKQVKSIFEASLHDPESETINRERIDPESLRPTRQAKPQILREDVEEHRGRGRQPARLTKGALYERSNQHIPDRPFSWCGRVRVEHAPAGGVREAECHLETVIFEDVSHGNTPEQRKLEAPPRRRGCNEMAGADTSHHQNEPGAKMPH